LEAIDPEKKLIAVLFQYPNLFAMQIFQVSPSANLLCKFLAELASTLHAEYDEHSKKRGKDVDLRSIAANYFVHRLMKPDSKNSFGGEIQYFHPENVIGRIHLDRKSAAVFRVL
jgi:hypothetical protein